MDHIYCIELNLEGDACEVFVARVHRRGMTSQVRRSCVASVMGSPSFAITTRTFRARSGESSSSSSACGACAPPCHACAWAFPFPALCTTADARPHLRSQARMVCGDRQETLLFRPGCIRRCLLTFEVEEKEIHVPSKLQFTVLHAQNKMILGVTHVFPYKAGNGCIGQERKVE